MTKDLNRQLVADPASQPTSYIVRLAAVHGSSCAALAVQRDFIRASDTVDPPSTYLRPIAGRHRLALRLAPLLACAALQVSPASALAKTSNCPPADWDRPRLQALVRTGFTFDSTTERDRFVLDILPCLSAADPWLRDSLAYEAMGTLLRSGRLPPKLIQTLAQALVSTLDRPDPDGFGPPFAALVLSELVRADAKARALSPAQLDSIAQRGAAFLAGVRDYRSFDELEGWRHAVAHGADLLAQLARHPGVDDPSLLSALRDAVATQVAPAAHAYTHGEPERLMVPIVLLARRQLFSAADWHAWFRQLADPAPMAGWGASFGDSASLARRHNLRVFLFALLTEVRMNRSTDDDVLLPAAESALRSMQ
ncbi:MAG: DUF2785 domain-containing protein [Burkholderiaceae bacterium]|nr:DUF2785 domain-containing protein [Aquabacterium sp.]NUP85436.1 DUF2785 domain-containing protein [Burkholderiaceae bacterium]